MYADSYCNSAQPFGTNKLHRVSHVKTNEDFLVGGAGFLPELEFFKRILAEHGINDMWKLNLGEHWPPKIMKEFDTIVLVVTRSKQIFMFDENLVPMEINEESYCIGSGGDWARAYLDLVPSPEYEKAIEYAASRDENTRSPVHSIKFGRRQSPKTE
jgi:ATP-dependent protease HslVU (ClpYQ) peptidase subunit